MESVMSSPKVAFLGLMVTIAISGATAAPASASSIAALTRAGEGVNVEAPGVAAIPVAQLKCPPYCPPFPQQHDKFHERYHQEQPHFDDAHKRFHKYHRKPHSGSVIYFGWYGDYYDPFYYRPYTYDPYYDWPAYSKRVSCDYARKLVRQHGYRNVKSYDCQGKTYGFYATQGKKRYKVTVSARDGHIISRKRY
jgi:hypothetical protein